MINQVIFDLDGTLINSKEGIIQSLTFALNKEKCSHDIGELSIGPPLDIILKKMKVDKESIKNVKENFIQYYDKYGYKKTKLYPQTLKVLNDLQKKNITMYILTNKRTYPTERILKELEIKPFFEKVFCLDNFPDIQKKEYLLKYLISTNQLEKKNMLLIGDSLDDFIAAQSSSVPFVLAKYGYGNNLKESDLEIKQIDEILTIIKQN